MTEAAAQIRPTRRLPAEWEPVGAVLLAWPRPDGDWAPYLPEVRACYRRLLTALTRLVPVLLLVEEPERTRHELGEGLAALALQAPESGAPGVASPGPRLRLLASPARDTWTRDYGPITVLERPLASAAPVIARDPAATEAAVACSTAPAAESTVAPTDPPPQKPTACVPTTGPRTADATAPGAETAGAATASSTTAGSATAATAPEAWLEQPLLLDFRFNGWGGKYASAGDDAAVAALHASGALGSTPLRRLPLVLEGGSIESDGEGTLLTTSTCLLAPSRNPQLERPALEAELKRHLGAKRVLWLDQPALPGDDTDAHIDTLVRFCPNDTLVYVRSERESDCGGRGDGSGGGKGERGGSSDPSGARSGAEAGRDPLECQLRALRTLEGQPYRLVPLPPGPKRQAPDDGRPLPATYANALFLNGTLLLPVYGDPELDAAAEAAWRRACPGWRILPLDCSALLLQHGSLHCATMQLPAALFR